MGLVANQQYEFGGVDSRSNPLNMPSKRMLRNRNFQPQRDGHLALRYGYEEFAQSAVTATPTHSLTGFQKLEGGRYAIFGQGTTLKVVDLATGNVTTPTVRGAAIAADDDWSWAFANNQLHGYNGTDRKFFDGTVWRDPGVRAPSAAEAAAVTVTIGAPNANAIPASSVGGAQPGYQFYMAYYNRQSGQVGNRVKIGSRLVPTVAGNVNIGSLPDLSGEDTELDILIGRTIDGAEVPYAVMDTDGNHIYIANGVTSGSITQKDIDGNSELPLDNGVPPAFDKVAWVGDRLVGNRANSPYIEFSAAETDAADRGIYLGRPEQSFKANRIETFPTGQNLTCLKGFMQETWCFSRTHLAISSDLSGVRGWLGPFRGGCAGKEAFVETPYGPFWVSGDKQLLTISSNGPIPASDEYERGLLTKIGDLSKVKARYLRDVQKNIDAIFIYCLDSDGNPFQVVHDFAIEGQGYESKYLGALASAFDVNVVIDANGDERLMAGSSAGKLYTLHSGGTDDGNEYTASGIMLVNAGPDRPTIPYIEWYGDENAQWKVGKTLDSTPGSLNDISDTFEKVQGGENDFQYRVSLKEPECKHLYVEVSLQSHSADGNLDLNDPPHCPLETYGRIYMVSPLAKPGARGH